MSVTFFAAGKEQSPAQAAAGEEFTSFQVGRNGVHGTSVLALNSSQKTVRKRNHLFPLEIT